MTIYTCSRCGAAHGLHPRHRVAERLRIEIQEAVINAVEKHNPTHAELALVLSTITTSWAASAVKDEREDEEEPTP